MHRLAIFIDGSENDRENLRSACLLADLMDARLDVIFPLSGAAKVYAVAYDPVVADGGPGLEQTVEAAKATFKAVCGVGETRRFLLTSSAPGDAIYGSGLYYDALVLGRPDREEGPSAQAFNTALFEAGAPVLITPHQAPATIGRTAALVWSGTPQSARAVRSAMPVLKRCQEVCLLTNSDNAEAEPGPILEYLESCGIKASSHPFDGVSLTARGRAIIQQVQAVGADFMVMGAFGESQLGALFGLGRTTRKLVTATPVPLLLQN